MNAHGSAEADDMNATPLGKLPMPIMQTKADAPRVDASMASTSYADILRGLKNDGAAATSVQPQHHQPQHHQPQHQPQHLQHQPQQLQPEPLAQVTQAQLAQLLARHAPPSPPAYYDDSPGYSSRRPRRRHVPPPPRPPPRPPQSTLRRLVSEYKNAVAVALIVFVVMWWVAPKLASVLPSLAAAAGPTTTCGLRVPGLLAVAVLCGGIFRATERLTGGRAER